MAMPTSLPTFEFTIREKFAEFAALQVLQLRSTAVVSWLRDQMQTTAKVIYAAL